MTVSRLPLSKQACNMLESRGYLHIITINHESHLVTSVHVK